MSEDVQGKMAGGDSRWLSPVESERTTRRHSELAHGAFLPKMWTPDATVQLLVIDEGKIIAEDVPNGTVLAPSTRTDYAAVLSTVDRSLYMLGGLNQWGDLLHDAWRFDLDKGEWSELVFDGVGTQDIVDVAYDSATRQMMIVDRTVVNDTPTVRLVAVDLTRREANELASWDDLGHPPHAAIVSDGAGGFVLLVDRGTAYTVAAYRFVVASGKVQWKGEGSYVGTLVDGGQLTDGGVAFVRRAYDTQSITVVAPSDLGSATDGPGTF